MGTYRYFLAILVLISHFSFSIFGLSIGVVAVMSFLLLSGYVMTLLLEKHYNGLPAVGHFYLDRLFRLVPQFLLYSVIVLVFLAWTPLGSITLPWMTYQQCTAGTFALGFTLFVNNFYWLFGTCALLPAGWSLGLESFFYLSFPFVLALPKVYRNAILVVSIAIFCLGYAGVLNFDRWSYRLLPGVMFVFLAGSAIADAKLYVRHYPLIVFCLTSALLLVALFTPALSAVWLLKEVLVGIVAGIPMVFILSRFRSGKLDQLLGNLSYGVFLNHIFVLWIYVWIFGPIPEGDYRAVLVVLTVATALSYVSFTFVENNFLKIRRRLRSRP